MDDTPLTQRFPLTPEQELEAAKNYTTSVVNEIEKALIGEIEKMEGRVPSPDELLAHGKCRWDKDTLSQRYYWRDVLLVTVVPGHADKSGVRGTQILTHRQPDKARRAPRRVE